MELRLLLPTAQASKYPVTNLVLQMYNVKLHLTAPLDQNSTSLPPFVCISYRWGSNRLAHAFDETLKMSTATLPSLQAAVRIYGEDASIAYWIDAFCIPVAQPARTSTLASMGYIYSLAREVIVCLSAESATVSSVMQKADWVVEEMLFQLEKEDWVTSVWTYQELVNSKTARFVNCESSSDEDTTTSTPLSTVTKPPPTVSSEDMLNYLGFSLSKFKKLRSYNSFDIRRILPNLDTLVDLLADQMIGVYTSRSAYQVISAMDLRVSLNEYNVFYAMIGAISADAHDRRIHETVADLANEFTSICSSKGDYSWLFVGNERESNSSFKPKPQVFRSVVPWISWGDKQPGRVLADGTYQLDDVSLLDPTPQIDTRLKDMAVKWFEAANTLASPQEGQGQPTSNELNDRTLPSRVYETLTAMGFRGSERYTIVPNGLFFPQWQINTHHNANARVEVIVASEIRWPFGSPAMARLSHLNSGDIIAYVPGVLFGDLQDHPRISLVL